jgi:hypothetical protein
MVLVIAIASLARQSHAGNTAILRRLPKKIAAPENGSQ